MFFCLIITAVSRIQGIGDLNPQSVIRFLLQTLIHQLPDSSRCVLWEYLPIWFMRANVSAMVSP